MASSTGGGGGVAREAWGSRVGLVLAMAGQAVGLGNFLRFGRQVVLNGGGSFMVAYVAALLLLGLPMALVEWALGRFGGLHGKGHPAGMFACAWRHPASKYLGALSMGITLAVLSYYSCVESWAFAFMWLSLARDYEGLASHGEMARYVHEFHAVGWRPAVALALTLLINVLVIRRGIAGGIELLAKVAMPLMLGFAGVLLLVVLVALPPQAGVGASVWDGLVFMYRPEAARLLDASVWVAAAGQVFFTLSVGMGTLSAYASYVRRRDDIVAASLTAAGLNEAVEVALGGSLTIPAAVVFFGVAGALAIAAGGSFDLGFAVMPLVFMRLPLGFVLGAMWFALLFVAGITSSVAMATPIIAFLVEEFGMERERAALALSAVVVPLAFMHMLMLPHGFMDEFDYWAGTLGLVLYGLLEIVVFVWLHGPSNAWSSLHLGAHVRLPSLPVKYIIVYVTPLYLLVLLLWWCVQDAWPILTLQRSAGGGVPTADNLPYILASRAVLLAIFVAVLALVAWAWRRNAYDDRAGFPELDRELDQDDDVAAADDETMPLCSSTAATRGTRANWKRLSSSTTELLSLTTPARDRE